MLALKEGIHELVKAALQLAPEVFTQQDKHGEESTFFFIYAAASEPRIYLFI